MKLYEQYLHELGLGKKIALGAGAAIAGTLAYGIHQGKKQRNEDTVAGGERYAKLLIGISSKEADNVADDVWMNKCRQYEIESKELRLCEERFYDPAHKIAYLKALAKNRSKCKDPICVQSINKEIIRFKKYINKT